MQLLQWYIFFSLPNQMWATQCVIKPYNSFLTWYFTSFLDLANQISFFLLPGRVTVTNNIWKTDANYKFVVWRNLLGDVSIYSFLVWEVCVLIYLNWSIYMLLITKTQLNKYIIILPGFLNHDRTISDSRLIFLFNFENCWGPLAFQGYIYLMHDIVMIS